MVLTALFVFGGLVQFSYVTYFTEHSGRNIIHGASTAAFVFLTGVTIVLQSSLWLIAGRLIARRKYSA